MFAAALLVHHKIYHVQALAIGGAVRGEAVAALGFVVHLQAWGLVLMEGAVQPMVLVGFQPVVIQDLGEWQALFNFCYFHRIWISDRWSSNRKNSSSNNSSPKYRSPNPS